MAKLKNDQKIVYGAVAAASIFAIYLYLPQSTPTTSRVARPLASTATASAATDPADDTSVHFPRYGGSSRDPFIPKVALNNGPNASSALPPSQKWELTGIDTVNGITSALVENSTTQQSEYLKVGDTWNGLRVVSIGDDVVNFVNVLGLPSQLGFEAPPDPTSIDNQMNSNTPSINQIAPLPPLSPSVGLQNFSGSFQNGGRQ